MAKKKKQQGHYCRICGDYKANEKFSGKGHARHICKSCMSAMRSGKNPEDIFPEPLPMNRETTRFKKLGKEEQAVLNAFITAKSQPNTVRKTDRYRLRTVSPN